MSTKKRSRSNTDDATKANNGKRAALQLAQPAVKTTPDDGTNWNLVHFLLQTKVEQLKIKDNKIFVARRDDKIVDVWKGLLQHNFLSVPVLQKGGNKWYGFVDIVDIVHYVVQHFGQATVENEKFDFWKAIAVDEEFQRATVDKIMTFPLSRRNPFHPIYEGYSLLSAVEAMAREPTLHRVPIIDRQSRQLRNLITQSRIVEVIHNNFNLIGSKKNKKVEELVALGEDKVVRINQNEFAMTAFKEMSRLAITSICVVNDEAKLVGVISATDLKALQTDGRMFLRLYQTCHNYLEKVKKETDSTNRPRRMVTIKKETSLEEVLHKLFDNNIHHLFVVDDDHKPIGVVALREVLTELLNVSGSETTGTTVGGSNDVKTD